MKGKWLLFLFALPFFGVGVFMTYSIGSNVSDYIAMKSWQPVEATLQSAGYETFSDDGSSTYEAYARYTYIYDGQTFTNDRVGISGGADNIGDFHTETGNRLSSAMHNRESVIVFVNPENPQDSIAVRSLRWGLVGFKAIFMLTFGGVGLGLMLFTIFSSRFNNKIAEPVTGKPWLANRDWQSPVIKSGSRSTMFVTWFFAVIWNLISAPLPFVIYGEVLDKQNYLALVGLLFPLVGIGMFVWAVRNMLEWRRFGVAPLTLDPFPGSIGGHVGGTVDVNIPYDPSVQYSMTLTNLHSYMSGSGDNRSRRESAKWQDSQVAHAEHSATGTRLTFRFDVPDGLNESEADPQGGSYDLWRMNLTAELPGTDIDRDYEIPVYATRESSRNVPEFSVRQAKSVQNKIDDVAVRKLVTMGYGPNGRSMIYPTGRHLSGGFVGAIFGGIFAAIGGFLVFGGEALIIGIVFGLVGGLILLASLYSVLNSLEIYQDGGYIKTTRRLLGIPINRNELQRSNFRTFSKDSSMRSQSGSKHVIHYSVFAEDNAGHKIVVGEGLKGASEAAALMRLVASQFGLSWRDDDAQNRADSDDENLLKPAP